MRRILTTLTLALALAAGLTLHAQLPGAPVGAPQSQQNGLYGYNFAYTYTVPNTAGVGLRVAPVMNLTTLASQSQDVAFIGGTIVLPNSTASGTLFSALHIGIPTFTLNSAALTTAATLLIDGAPATGTTKQAVWVKAGNVQLDGGAVITGLTATGANVQQTFTASASATPTLLASQCGGMFAMDRTTATNYTLPVPVVGCTFDFIYTAAQASGTNEVQTSGGTVFLQGSPLVTGTTTSGFACNGTSHVSIKSNATTTGGLVGGHVKFTALSATLWDVQGVLVGSGTVATPCSTTP